MTDIEAARTWLEWLYGDRPDGLLWIGGHGDGFRGRTFTSIDDAVAYAAELDARPGDMNGVYHRLTTMRPVTTGRGAAVDSAYLPAFAMDLDLRGPGHKSDRYPEAVEDLVTLLRKAGLPEPSAWVHSGGGRYPFWKLEQPVDLTLPGELDRAARVSQDLHRLVIDWASEHGWKVDNTSDLARVYRLPGTMNRKPGVDPVMCEIASPHAGDRYGLAEMAGAVALAPRPVPIDRGPADRPAAHAEQRGAAGQKASQLFGGDAWADDAERAFSVSEALAFVTPALDALRSARDGEINVLLNEAALRLAHFGPEFWTREAAERQLYDALAATEYDGRTWKAADTIASGWRAGEADWRATLRPEPAAALEQATEQAEPDAVEALLAEMLTPEQIKSRPSKKYLIKGLLNMDSESWMIGLPGCRKSFVALDMAAHVASGRDWQGLKTRQGSVVIIAAEGAGGIGARIAAWEAEHGPMPQNVYILPRPVQTSDIRAWGVLVKACGVIGPVFTIIDTQARVTAGLKENTSEDMSVYITAVTAVRNATGACVLSIHHTSKAGQDARGHSSIDGAQDTELKVVAKQEPLRGELRVEKQKDLREGDPIELYFALHEVGMDEDGDPVTSLALKAADAWRGQDATPEAVETGQMVRIPEPEQGDWTWRIFDHHSQHVHRYILAALAEVTTPDAGITESSAQRLVRERWYEGRPLASNRKGHLSKATWDKAWAAARTAEDSARGERALLQNGDRWNVNPVVTGQ